MIKEKGKTFEACSVKQFYDTCVAANHFINDKTEILKLHCSQLQ